MRFSVKPKNKYQFLSFLLPFQIFAVYFLSKNSEWIESAYSNGIYIKISTFFRTVFGFIPFSVGDLAYTIFIFYLVKQTVHLIRKKHNRINTFFKITASLSVFYFFFYLLWGLNYARLPIEKSMGLTQNHTESHKLQYNIQKLENLSEKLILKVKTIQLKIVDNDTMAIKIPYSKSKILSKTKIGYDNLSQQFAQFSYQPSSIKKSFFSLPLTYMGFSGYFNPFTGEAQVDYLIPKISLPATSSHEAAHQLGIASESEANFIGFLAANRNDDLYFQYAANLMALQYVLLDIYRYDTDLYKNYKNKLSKGILKNINESKDFWAQYKNPTEPFFKLFYDQFLKYNYQKEGIKSYNHMVRLLISYNDTYALK